MKQYLEVVCDFNSLKIDTNDIRPQYARILSILQKGQKINVKEFIEQHKNEFTRKGSLNSSAAAIYHAITDGKKIGMLKPLPQTQSGVPISFTDFCKLDTVNYCMSQLSGSKFKNIIQKSPGTAGSYAYHLWHFNNWLHGKEFEFTSDIPTSNNTFRREKIKIKLQGLEHLLELYRQSYNADADFVKIAKTFLLDPKNKDLRASYMKIKYNAIKSYFDKNDSPLEFRFNPKSIYKFNNGEDEEPSLSLEDVMNLLTVGRPSTVQKAVFLCKLHRGLDNATLIDRFNFQVWEQLVDYFGTEDYTKWDLVKCPVPIKLTRIKTDYFHTGFLDRDAVEAIQKYLAFRQKQALDAMKVGQPLFINQKGRPINTHWIRSSLKKLSKNAGLDKKLSGYTQNRYKINSHEFRDLLKSTLMDCGVRPDVADHCIGHKPKDTYEKQYKLYPHTMRSEFNKASKRLNIFSNFASMAQGVSNMQELSEKVTNLEQELVKQKLIIKNQKKFRKRQRAGIF